ncbi:MAG: hemolysin family protein [Nocardioides sp.]|uniref:hemolysin family protein n=1 Tax=Nocardioides sp. TaxID=35761 RepID=UPI0039E23417
MSTPFALVVGLVLLLLNALFVGAEFALVASRRSQIEPAAQAGSRLARITLAAMENVSLMMAGAQLGITVCSVLLGAVAEPALAHLLSPAFHAVGVPSSLEHPIAFAIALLIVVFLHVVLGEMVPKNIALAGPDRAALVLGPAIYGVVTVLRPVIVALNAIANRSVRLLRIEPKEEVVSTYTRAEVAALVEESHGEGLLQEDEYDRLAGALGFTEKRVEAVLIPLSRWQSVPRGASGADVEALCAATGYSRFPVEGDDGPIGYLHIKDVLEPDEARRQRPVEDKWIRPFAPVALDDALHEALETLQRRGAHLARVVDGEGSTVGLATLEDVIEELVGEIRDAAHADEPREVSGS